MKEYKINSDVMETFKKMLDETIDCCVTDCPYIVEAGGTRMIYLDENGESQKNDWSKTDPKGCLNRGKVVYVTDSSPTSQKWIKRDGSVPSAVKDGKMFEHNDISFADWLPELYRVMKNGTHTYIMINSRNLCELQTEAEICGNTEEEKEKIRKGGRLKRKGFIFQNLLVWKKGNYTPNKYYMQGAEFILMLRKGPARNINDMGSTNIIDIPNIIGKKKHPTEKPVELYKYLLKNSTNPGNWAFDPFAGSGPIVEAGRELGLNTIAVEIDEEYFKILNER